VVLLIGLFLDSGYSVRIGFVVLFQVVPVELFSGSDHFVYKSGNEF
jgi:hypothetical protein